MFKNQASSLKQCALASMFISSLSACDSPEGFSFAPASANNAPDVDNADVTIPIDVSNSNVDFSVGPGRVISGDISVQGDGIPIGDAYVQVRDTNLRAPVQSNGEFFLVVPSSDTDEEIILDIIGENIVEKSMSIQLPADSTGSVVKATIAVRALPISFDLDVGGDLRNEESSTRTTVSVPANAFEFSDGTPASGMAQVSITELDILDLEADYSWAPNFIGIPEGSTETTAIRTFGMSEFHFSQNGQELALRPGARATISMDLAAPYIMTDENGIFEDATVGAVMPMWYYDTEDLVWREEGEVVVAADNESNSGYKATGDVSHFTYWNIDWVTPFMPSDIHVKVVDQNGVERSDVEVMTYSALVRVPPEAGIGSHGETAWQNSKVLTPLNNQIDVIGNYSGRGPGGRHAALGLLDMDIYVSDVTTRDHGVISTDVMKQTRSFLQGADDSSVNFEVVLEVPDPEPELMSAEIILELVDLDGIVIQDSAATSYTVSAVADNGWSNRNITLTPALNRLVVLGNTQEWLDTGAAPVSMQVTLDKLVVDGQEVSLLAPISVNRVFNIGDDVSRTYNVSDAVGRLILNVPFVDFLIRSNNLKLMGLPHDG